VTKKRGLYIFTRQIFLNQLEDKMSEDIYFYNKTKKEYIRGYGNGNRADSLRNNFPILLTWLLMNDWIYDQIYCVGFKQMDYILSAIDKTDYYEKIIRTTY